MADRAGIAWRAVPAALWSRRSWLALAHLITGGLLWAAPVYLAVGVASVAGQVSRSVDAPHNKLINVSVALGVLAVALFGLFALTPRFTRWQRVRFHAVLGVELVPHPPGPVRSRRFWRQACYHALGGLLCAVSAALVALLVWVGAVLFILPLVAPKWGLPLPLTALGAALVLAAPWLARGAASVDLVLAGALLQPSGAEALAQRVRSLSASRAGAVDAADAERRRIERNLHDGTQQRLVSLAMNLGMTRAAMPDGPAVPACAGCGTASSPSTARCASTAPPADRPQSWWNCRAGRDRGGLDPAARRPVPAVRIPGCGGGRRGRRRRGTAGRR